MDDKTLGFKLRSFCAKNDVIIESNFLHFLTEVGDKATELFKREEGVLMAIKKITGVDNSFMECPVCGSNVLVEYVDCPVCGEKLMESGEESEAVEEPKKAKKEVKEDKPAPIAKEEQPSVAYPSKKNIEKMPAKELKKLVAMLNLDIDVNGKVGQLRKDIVAELYEEVEAVEEVAEVVSSDEVEVDNEDLEVEDLDLDLEFEEFDDKGAEVDTEEEIVDAIEVDLEGEIDDIDDLGDFDEYDTEADDEDDEFLESVDAETDDIDIDLDLDDDIFDDDPEDISLEPEEEEKEIEPVRAKRNETTKNKKVVKSLEEKNQERKERKDRLKAMIPELRADVSLVDTAINHSERVSLLTVLGVKNPLKIGKGPDIVAALKAELQK